MQSEWNDLANDAFSALAKPVPGRKVGDLGSMSANLDEMIVWVKAKILERVPYMDNDQAQSEAEEAVWNAD